MIVLLLVYSVLYIGTLCAALLVLSRVLHKQPLLRADYLLVFSIAALVIASYVGTRNESIIANFFQHAVGGGFVVGLLTLFMIRAFHLRLPLFAVIVLIVATVSTLGVANELLEFLLQTVTPLRFANNTSDTWRDLAANTTGALLATAVAVFMYKKDRDLHA